MDHRPQVPLPDKLVQGQASFEQWRNQHRPRTRLPAHLWALATELAIEFGIHRTAKALRLDYYALKKRLPDSDDRTPSSDKSASPFWELFPLTSPGSMACSVECRDPEGGSLQVHLHARDLTELADFCIRLWHRGR